MVTRIFNSFGHMFKPVKGKNSVQRVATYCLAACSELTRREHLALVNTLIEQHPILLILNLDETAVGAATVALFSFFL